jgi:hypothetical protein
MLKKNTPKTSRKKPMPSLGSKAMTDPESLTLAEIRRLGAHELGHQAAHKKTLRKPAKKAAKKAVKRTAKRTSRR